MWLGPALTQPSPLIPNLRSALHVDVTVPISIVAGGVAHDVLLHTSRLSWLQPLPQQT